MSGQSRGFHTAQSTARLQWVRTHPKRLAAGGLVWEAAKALNRARGDEERFAARASYLSAITELREIEAELTRRYEDEKRNVDQRRAVHVLT
jgi:hypothetical protein